MADAAAAAALPMPLDAASADKAAEQQLQFEWVPAHVVSDLREVGDWKRRAAAVEVLHAAARAAAASEPHLLLSSFSAFLDFFLPLLADPNFKIATSAVTILEVVVGGLGPSVAPYLGALTSALADRLGDALPLARAAAARGLAALARAAGPQAVVNALGGALVADAWRVREEALNVAVALLLTHGRGAFDYPRVVAAFVSALADDQPRVATVSLEGLALLAERLGPLLQGLLTTVGAGVAAKARVAARVAATPQLGLPQLDASGAVQHQPHARPPSAKGPSPQAALLTTASREGSLTAAAGGAYGFAAATSLAAIATAELPAASAWVDQQWQQQQTLAPAASKAAAAALPPSNPLAGLSWVPGAGLLPPPHDQMPASAAEAAATEEQQQVERSGGSLLTWVRPACSPSASLSRAAPLGVASVASASAAAPLASQSGGSPSRRPGSAERGRLRWSPSRKGKAADPAPAPAYASPSSAAAAQQDLHVSVRAWQQQQAPVLAPADGSEERVEASGGSLLQWRVPSRSAASATQRPPSEPAVGPGLFHKLGSFRKKLFGSEEAPAAATQQQRHPGLRGGGSSTGRDVEPGRPEQLNWSIPAVRGSDAAQPAAEPAAAASLHDPQAEEQPASPSSILGKLRQLKARQQEAAERRRVWSAPAQPAADGDAGDGNAGAVGGEEPPAEQLPQREGSARPSLQALKIRARSARLLSAGSRGTSAAAPAADPLYSLEALDDVFGPDRSLPPPPSLAAPGGGWSPVRIAVPEDGYAAMLSRQGSGQSSWPSSPGGSAPGSPARLSLKRGSSSASTFLSKLSGSPSPDGSSSPAAGSAPAFSPATTDLSPLKAPEAALSGALAALASAATSQRKELDWQAQLDALGTLRRLARHHAGVLLPSLHAVVAGAAPAIDSLRSIPARLALVVFQDLISAAGPALEPELEAFVPGLLKRAGAVSVAGRDSFLAMEADKALAALLSCGASGVRVASALLAALGGTKSPDVRAKAATHLAACCAAHGAALVGAANVPLHGRLLKAAAGLLEEGNPESRAGARRMVLELRDAVDAAAGAGTLRAAVGRLDCRTDRLMELVDPGGGRPGSGRSPARVPSAGAAWALRPPSGRLNGGTTVAAVRQR